MFGNIHIWVLHMEIPYVIFIINTVLFYIKIRKLFTWKFICEIF